MDYCPTDAIELIPTEKEQTKQEITKETLKPKVIEEKCIGCGSCISLTDQKIFDFNDNGKAQAITSTINEEDINLIKNAMDYCPTDAIELVENDEEK